MCKGCGAYPHVPDEALININNTPYLVSICLTLLFIFVLSALCAVCRNEISKHYGHIIHRV